MTNRLSERVPSAQPAVPDWRRIVMFWLVLRVSLSLWALLCSFSVPFSALEKQTAVWPPSQPIGTWLQRILLAPLNRWDVEHYLKISTHGYQATDGTSQFHPLYPFLGKAAGWLFGGNELLGLFVVSNLSAIALLISLERLASLDLSPASTRRVSSYLLMLPAAFILFVPYTESLFLLCSVLCWLYARQGRWLRAGLAGALAVLTRQQGIFLLLPLAWEFWHWAERDWKTAFRRWKPALNLLLIPAALIGWIVYRAIALSDIAFELGRPQTWIYGLLISRSAFNVVQEQSFVFPWQAIATAFRHFSAINAIDLAAGSCYLLTLGFGGRWLWQLRPSYVLYSVVIVLISFSYSTTPPWVYMGLPRHCLLAFPLVFILAEWGRKKSAHLLISAVGFSWLLFLTMVYVLLWVP